MADPKKIRSAAPFIIIVFFFFISVYLGAQNQALNHTNRTLSEKSKALELSLKEAEEKTKELFETSQKSQAEKNTIQEELDALKKEHESLKVEAQKLDTKAKAAAEEKTYLEEMLLNKNKAIEILKKSSKASAEGPATGSAELMAQIKQKDEEIKNLDEQNKILGEKLERLYKTTQNKIGEITVAKIALEETVSSAKSKIEEEWNTVNLGTVSAKPASQETRKLSKKEGRVIALNEEHGFVVVDFGKIDNLGPDTRLEVKRDNEIVATLSVLEVRDDMSACNIKSLKDGMKIQVNDPVFIL